MEKRIKILYGFTAIVIVLFATMQCNWLYSRYRYTLHEYQDTLYNRVLNVIEVGNKLRRASVNDSILVLSNMKLSVSNTTHCFEFDIYTINTQLYAIEDSLTFETLARIYESEHPAGIEKHTFVIDNTATESDVFDALERFRLDECVPMEVEPFDSLLRHKGMEVRNIELGRADSMIWHPIRIDNVSLRHKSLMVVYPYDIFEGEYIRIDCAVGLSPVIRQMADALLLSLLLSVLLIGCLVAQIATIREQHRIENLRSDFIHAMIHELKRPIATLKICVSYMGNEQLMQDVASRQTVIADSHLALDSLSAYFSKLRDLTFSRATEIPLNLSSFSLRDLLNTCIGKLNLSDNKKVVVNLHPDTDITITADKIHLINIIDNLLENAVKYSREDVHIEIDYQEQKNDSIRISVKDNGLGISKSDSKHIFEKFYRSRAVIDKGIPGMGLGLTYVRMLVEAHRGTIRIESEQTLGSTFIIELPQ
ncbi:sensor histidine kinase [Phocaeicola barnesiae]|uniref:sensor histidine kinase n=1 Tax=Phocaeicola barnesiae TaxID=376804 RepID=UPI002431FE23|nr:HAMP domain-containing sensor histidine kinase [Phocaeicola barnesiae]